jgi:hypothetical protein
MPDKTRATNETTETLSRTALRRTRSNIYREDQRRCQRDANCRPLEGGRILLSHRQIVGQANLTDPSINERFSSDKLAECFKEYADMLSWDRYWRTTLDTSNPPFWKWFVGGKLNAYYNCVDRHLSKYGNKAALIFVLEPEDEGYQAITYQELWARVNEVATMLRDFGGLKTGDRVTLHLAMVPELPITLSRDLGLLAILL